MFPTEPINYLIAACAASLPAIYVVIVARTAKADLDHTEELSREPGQTNHTAILDLHSADGHVHHDHHDLQAAGLSPAMAQG